MAEVVSIHRIISWHSLDSDYRADSHGARKMCDVLKRQGQIEPLQVRRYSETFYITHEHDVHGGDIVSAAKLLGWKTLLVVETERYQE